MAVPVKGKGVRVIGSTLAHALVKRGDKAVVIDDFNDFTPRASKGKTSPGFRETQCFGSMEPALGEGKRFFGFSGPPSRMGFSTFPQGQG